ncbi:synaptotagmin 2-like [Lineus longissimus]|uniref:synaptotagmin 2-like n=1 Tax=Lineus longissimus TaxID=88925 RepID=UPI002B4D19C7
MGTTASTENQVAAPAMASPPHDVEAGPGGDVQKKKLIDSEKIKMLSRVITAKSSSKRRRKPVRNDPYVNTKENMVLLKQIFKKLDPSVMKTTSDIQGELQMSLKYDAKEERLLVKVIKARELNAKDLRGNGSDPFVKVWLHPDRWEEGIKRTSTEKKTTNPIFGDVFTFKLTEEELHDTKVVAQVWDWDRVSSDDFMGEIIMDLATTDFIDRPIYSAWFPLALETDMSISGEIEISLEYRLPQTLLVTVHRASDLVPRDIDKKADPYVKVSIPGKTELGVTEVQSDTLNPVWDETFEFSVPYEEFNDRYIVLHIVDKDTLTDNESMGQAIVDLGNLDPEVGFRGVFQLADLRNSDKLRSKWSQKAIQQEFKEALIAHASFRYPRFMFQHHEGLKVMTLTSEKAGATAKLRIMDGVIVN